MPEHSADLDAIVGELAELLHVDGALLRLREGSGGLRVIVVGRLADELRGAFTVAPMLLGELRHPIGVDEVAAAGPLQAALAGIRGQGIAVRSSTGAFLGELWVLCARHRPITRAERRALGLFAAEIGRALDRARIVEEESVVFGDSDARYAAIVEAMAEGIVVQASDGRIIAANRAAEVILQMTADELRGRSSLDPEWRAIREDGAPFPGDQHPAMVSLRTGRPQSGVIMGVRRGKVEATWISINSVPLFHPGADAPFGVVASFADITALKRVEEELEKSFGYYRRFFEHSVDGLLIGKPDGRLLDANPAACALLGRSLAELRALGRSGLVEAVDPNIERYLESRARTGVARGPLNFLRPDGSILHTEHAAMDFRDGEGDDFTVVSFRDATSEWRFERAKRDFLAMVSHELRTPLTSIRGTLGLLAGGVLGPLSPEGSALASAATANAERLARLISDLLDSSTMDAGTFAIVASSFSVAALVDESSVTIEPLLGPAGVRLERSVEGSDEAFGDRFRLQQVLINLLGNAVKFSPRAGTIELRVLGREGGGLRCEVRDRGPGVRVEDRPRLFEPFVQLDPSDTRSRGGAGLGLAISKAIVDAHGGQIGVEPREGGGSIFWFEIPGRSDESATS